MSDNSRLGQWRKSVVRQNATLQEVIANLNETTVQIVLVLSDDGELLGTVTDGDIRRGMLRGLDMQDPISTIIHKDPLVVPPHLERSTVLELMHANKITQLPVVDENRHVVDLHLWDELMSPRERANIMLIMAGGRGSRLKEHTDNMPKPLLHVGGKPMLEHIIERAKAEGFHHFVLAVHYLGEKIEEYFGDGSRWQVKIDYLREESPLGTAGAISLLNSVPDAPILVTNGDVLTDIHYAELLDFHCRHKATATMAVSLHEWQHPYGVVHTKGLDITGFEEKPIARSYVNSGIYVLEPYALDCLEHGEHCDMPTLFSRLQHNSERTIVYPMHEPWLDLGQVEDFEKAQKTMPDHE